VFIDNVYSCHTYINRVIQCKAPEMPSLRISICLFMNIFMDQQLIKVQRCYLIRSERVSPNSQTNTPAWATNHHQVMKYDPIELIPLGCRRARSLYLFRSALCSQVAKLFSYTWTMGEFLCKAVHYIQNVSAISSVLTLTAMSTERCVYTH
jgi:hypothetical protein